MNSSRRSTLYEDASGMLVRIQHDTGRKELVINAPRNRSRCSYMLRAKEAALHSGSVEEMASKIGVSTSTAWSYVTALASEDEEFAAHCCKNFVSSCIRQAIRSVDTRGSLTEVMERVSRCASNDPEWRTQTQLFQQLRLARLACTA